MKISNFLQSGRSMVEMLGVLAIVGVLSVGGIAGYSKAMMKYKLNKHAESFNMLLNDVLRLNHEFHRSDEEKWTYYGDFFNKLGLIPDGFEYIDNRYIKDNFGNRFSIYSTSLNYTYLGGIMITLKSIQKEVCYNFVQTAKENSANLRSIMGEVADQSDGYKLQGDLYGDNYCTSNRKCLKDLKIDDFEELCDTDKLSLLFIIW